MWFNMRQWKSMAFNFDGFAFVAGTIALYRVSVLCLTHTHTHKKLPAESKISYTIFQIEKFNCMQFLLQFYFALCCGWVLNPFFISTTVHRFVVFVFFFSSSSILLYSRIQKCLDAIGEIKNYTKLFIALAWARCLCVLLIFCFARVYTAWFIWNHPVDPT